MSLHSAVRKKVAVEVKPDLFPLVPAPLKMNFLDTDQSLTRGPKEIFQKKPQKALQEE